MIGIDTNVLLRFLVDDDVAQNDRARRFMAERTEDDPVYLSAVVLAETVWVLRRRLGYSQRQITEMLRQLLVSVEVVVEYAGELEVTLLETEATISDLADCLVAWAALKAGCSKVVTFDRKAARAIPGMELLS
ncbi:MULTISPECIES: PIN domain-containing protein [Rhizobiaceae]|uniref:Ribonuclease VapC n=1 Tax=Mycoplana azooxidifex TaxID=1636188 RepID=A0A7W6GIR6_9HYPH|nr:MULTISPECIES: PIN domain-containing protein [Rhizobiaceae]MBB3977251.1 putative nucleic-acid-binding protein [Mycoplana azooxidifex]MCD2183177.1 PIN domain-containing protein [Rhizobium sp. GN54]